MLFTIRRKKAYHLFTRIEEDYLGNSANNNVPVKPIDSWSRGIRRRLLVESTFENPHQTLSLEMEVNSTIMRQDISRNLTFLRLYYCRSLPSMYRSGLTSFLQLGHIVRATQLDAHCPNSQLNSTTLLTADADRYVVHYVQGCIQVSVMMLEANITTAVTLPTTPLYCDSTNEFKTTSQSSYFSFIGRFSRLPVNQLYEVYSPYFV
ncbi:unnamed protein product [Protopolystoma xenopodis]|uniref:Uncharacterized protein n=1 Tax=Protopolystoma xenopodis TaxID=117903 RepID=A0A3S5A5A4_9PLAT|nr:unnamed protein product [Protopolystoma xenopodis]